LVSVCARCQHERAPPATILASLRRSAAQRAIPGSLKELLAADLQLRIELMHIEPHVWRRVIVPETVTLAKLHQILQAVMGWTDTGDKSATSAQCDQGPDGRVSKSQEVTACRYVGRIRVMAR